MTFHEFYEEFYNLTQERRKQFMINAITMLVEDSSPISEEAILSFVDSLSYLEEDDYFGTEGFNG